MSHSCILSSPTYPFFDDAFYVRWSEITPAVQGIGGCSIADMEQFAAFECYCLTQCDKSLAALARPGVCMWPSQQVFAVPHAMVQPSLDAVDAALSDGGFQALVKRLRHANSLRFPICLYIACGDILQFAFHVVHIDMHDTFREVLTGMA
jgi:hypothetical protein